jgi:hypothetical protein
MGRFVAITRGVVERTPGLIATPWAAIIGIILLLDRIFDVFLGTGAPADATLQRLGGVPALRSRSSESDNADAQCAAPVASIPEPAVVGAELAAGEGNPFIHPAGHNPPEFVHVTVQRSDGAYVGPNEAWEQGMSLQPDDGDGKGPRYESDYRPGRVGAGTMGTVRIQHRER